MAQITVVATITARPDAVETVKTELLRMIAPTRQEPGCMEYRLHQDNQNPARFVFYENWDSPAALAGHMASAHYQSYAAVVGSLLAEKVVHQMTELTCTLGRKH